jgi:hypothetical protein
MLKRFGLPVLALASALAVAAPTMTFAADRNDHRGGPDQRGPEIARHETFRGRDDRRVVVRDDHARLNFGVGFYAPPVSVPVARGFYDQCGVWHTY